ncbi:E3 SUMO-protein ligase pli1 [Coemansia sp. RSA 2050]|nr:E3 SUMO-protein ligase pli1 [Coemansia sp. RSA 2050]
MSAGQSNAIKVLPVPEEFQPSVLGSLRIVDIRYVLDYARSLHQTRYLGGQTLKAALLELLKTVLCDLLTIDQTAYGLVLGCASQLSPKILEYTHFENRANNRVPIPRTGSWITFRTMPCRNDVALARSDGHGRPSTQRQSAEGAPQAHMAKVTANGTIIGIAHGLTPSGLDGLVFGDSNFVLPVQLLTRPEVFMESAQRMNTKVLNLKLTIDQVDMLNGDSAEGESVPYGVFLFMCQYTDACHSIAQTPKRAVDVAFPTSLIVAANNTVVWPGTEHSQCKSPINLTGLILKSPESNNIVRVTYSTAGRWVAALVLSKSHTAQSIASEIRKSRFITADQVRRAFFSNTNTDDDDELVSTGALVSLKCPLGLSRITTPTRSAYCQHSQCFDCEIFMQLTRKFTVWKCPVCSIVIKSWRELVVDGYFESILKATSAADDQVYIEPNGEWKPKKEAPTPRKELKATTGRPLEIEDSDAIDLSDSSTAGYQPSGRNKRRRTDVVDLTLDSDDEDDGIVVREARISLTQEEIDFVSSVEDALLSPDSLSTNLSTGSPTSSSSATTLNSTTPPSSGSRPAQAASRQSTAHRPPIVHSTPPNTAPKLAATAPPARSKNKHGHRPLQCRRTSWDNGAQTTSNSSSTLSHTHTDTPNHARQRAAPSNACGRTTCEADTERNANAISYAVAYSAARASRILGSALSGSGTDVLSSGAQFDHAASLATALTTRTHQHAPTTISAHSASLEYAAPPWPRLPHSAVQTGTPQRRLTTTPIAPRLSTAAPNTVPRPLQIAAPPAAHRSQSQGSVTSQSGFPVATAPSSIRPSRGAAGPQPLSPSVQPVHVGMSPTYSSLFLSPQTTGPGSTAGSAGVASNERINGPASHV